MAKPKSTTLSLGHHKSEAVAIRGLLGDIRLVIEAARAQTTRVVNSTLVVMYWQIGKRIREDALGNERAEYGKIDLIRLSGALADSFAIAIFTSGRSNNVEGHPF